MPKKQPKRKRLWLWLWLNGRFVNTPAADASQPRLELRLRGGSHGRWPSDPDAHDRGRVHSGVPGDQCRQEAHERGRSRAAKRPVRPQGCTGTHPQGQRGRLHRQVCPGVARASWREDLVHRAGFTVGERLPGELLSCCSGTKYWNGQRSTCCSRPRCSSSAGGSTATRAGRTVPWGTGVRNRTRLACRRAKP